MNNKVKIIIIVILLLVLVGGGYYFFFMESEADKMCKRNNVDYGEVKAVEIGCTAGGCNSELGGDGWLDLCNGPDGYTCCAKK